MASEHMEMWDEVQAELRHVLACPIGHLLAAAPRTLSVDAGQQWDIPQSDRAALREWGLPPLALFTAMPQSGSAPLIARDPAGEQERRLLNAAPRLYRLGYWGPREDSGVVGVVPGGGRVLYLLPAPITVDDLPEILKPYYAGLYKPAVSPLSSSVAQYAETAWRWHAALQILDRVRQPAPGASESEAITHYERLYASVDLVLQAARRIDPAVAAQSPRSVWVELIRENSI